MFGIGIFRARRIFKLPSQGLGLAEASGSISENVIRPPVKFMPTNVAIVPSEHPAVRVRQVYLRRVEALDLASYPALSDPRLPVFIVSRSVSGREHGLVPSPLHFPGHGFDVEERWDRGNG